MSSSPSCSGTSSSCTCSTCECTEPLTVSKNSSVSTPICSCSYRSTFNFSIYDNEFQSLDGSFILSSDIDSDATHMDSIHEENRIEDFDTFIIDVKEEQTEELFVNEEIPDGVVLGQEEIWIPPVESQDLENVSAMENSVPYEFVFPVLFFKFCSNFI